MIATMANVQEAHETQVLNVMCTVPEETSDLIEAVLNPKEKSMKSASFFFFTHSQEF
jgi:hypothetical protein